MVGYPWEAKVLLMLSVLSGFVSSFIEPDRSTTKAMSRGFVVATVIADWLIEFRPRMRAKKKGVSPPVLWSVRVVTRTALPTVADGVKTRAVGSQFPYSMSEEFSWTGLPEAWWYPAYCWATASKLARGRFVEAAAARADESAAVWSCVRTKKA